MTRLPWKLSYPPSKEIILKAFCKINLYLAVKKRRADGYHELETLFYALREPADTLKISAAAEGSGLNLVCNLKDLPNADNLLSRAYTTFSEYTGFKPDLHVVLEKNIPIGAGLAGGSSDAAVLLKALNALAGEKAVEDEMLSVMALRLGSDIPFFLYAESAWAKGRGEKLVVSEIDLSDLYILLICPPFAISTPWAYKAWDLMRQKAFEQKTNDPDMDLTEDTSRNIESIFYSPCSIKLPGLNLFNSLEQAVFPFYPALRLIKEGLLYMGASASLMTGSGSTVFGLFREKEKAEKAMTFFEKKGNKVFINCMNTGV